MFKIMHQSVEEKSKEYYEEMRRRVYLTPTSYLAVLNLYKFVLNEQRQLLGTELRRKDNGVKKLEEANKEVLQLQQDLMVRQPELEKTQVQLVEKTKVLAVEYEQAEETRKNMALQEADAKEKEESATKLSNDADNEVKRVEPQLKEAVAQLKEVKTAQLVELKAYGNLTDVMKAVYEAMIYLFGAKLSKPTDPGAAAKDPRGILKTMREVIFSKNPEALKEELCDYKSFIASMTSTELENRFSKIEPIISNPDIWNVKIIAKNSSVLKAFYFWINALKAYSDVSKIVQPLREKAKEYNNQKLEARRMLEEKRAKLKEIDDKIAGLEVEKKKLIERENQLKSEIADCKRQLENAGKLTKGLEGEKTRWTEEVMEKKEKSTFLIGDCLVAAGMLAYSGPFTSDYRLKLEGMWVSQLDKFGILHSPNLTMRSVLGNQAVVREWVNKYSLPDDNLSVENGIILESLRRWPLIIDPQNQAVNYIKARGSAMNKLSIDFFFNFYKIIN